MKAGGGMGWRPDEVRACSLGDFAAACEGWAEAHGAKPKSDHAETRDLVAELREMGLMQDG